MKPGKNVQIAFFTEYLNSEEKLISQGKSIFLNLSKKIYIIFIICNSRYRDGGKEVIDVMCSFGVVVERASIDEAYIDMTAVIDKMLSDSTGWLKVKFSLMKFVIHFVNVLLLLI
jgi:hypothetical protein